MDKRGNSAYHFAAFYGFTRVFNRLLSSNKIDKVRDQLRQPNEGGVTPIQAAAVAAEYTELGSIMPLLLRTEDPERVHGQDTAGWTVLHWAAWYGRLELVSSVVKGGNDLTAKDALGRTACDLAEQVPSVSLEIVEWLTPIDVSPKSSAPLELIQPVCDEGAKQICQSMKVQIMDIYGGGETLKKPGFSMFNCLYDYGPHEVMSAVARTRRKEGLLDLRWVHLPANNVSTGIFGGRHHNQHPTDMLHRRSG